MINQDPPLKDLLSVIDFEKNKFHKTKHNLFLTTYEMNILDKYHIRYNNCHTAKEILQEIEHIILDLEQAQQEELDQVGMSIAERDYYQNTNK